MGKCVNYYQDIFSLRPYLEGFDPLRVPSASYVIDLGALKRNLEILAAVKQRTGVKILLALKGVANFCLFPLINQYLDGCCASSPHEARLAQEEFGKEVHSFAPAYTAADFKENLALSDHIVFNSFSQWRKYKSQIELSDRKIAVGLRVNPEHSETALEIYDPCAVGSRLGIPFEQFKGQDLQGIDGLHFHTLCQKNADALHRTAMVFEQKFSSIIKNMQWLNFGGGHHITQPGYDIDLLCETITYFKNKYGVVVYLEPGEAVGINTGSLICSVVDILENKPQVAILDISVTCHMPDVLEMPYRPEVRGAAPPGVKKYQYKLGGLSCLAGDVVGDYSFDRPLAVGDQLLFDDMTHYTMVKTSFFNGIKHPSIVVYCPEQDEVKVVKRFGYEDYRHKLS